MAEPILWRHHVPAGAKASNPEKTWLPTVNDLFEGTVNSRGLSVDDANNWPAERSFWLRQDCHADHRVAETWGLTSCDPLTLHPDKKDNNPYHSLLKGWEDHAPIQHLDPNTLRTFRAVDELAQQLRRGDSTKLTTRDQKKLYLWIKLACMKQAETFYSLKVLGFTGPEVRATATFDGAIQGEAIFHQPPFGQPVNVTLSLRHVPPGPHALAICNKDGSHFNPRNHPHGKGDGAQSEHLGDLGEIVAELDGTVSRTIPTKHVSLGGDFDVSLGLFLIIDNESDTADPDLSNIRAELARAEIIKDA
jgi:Cu/Zn superoxide dismutase